MGIGEPHCDRLAFVTLDLGDALVGRRLYWATPSPRRHLTLATLALGVSSPRRRLTLTLTPDVDFDLDFVNARIRDGTGVFPHVSPPTWECNCARDDFLGANSCPQTSSHSL